MNKMVDDTINNEDREGINNVGASSFKVSKWDQLDRFLILGTESNTMYASNVKLTEENAKIVRELLKKNPRKTIDRIVEVSDQGLASNNDYALYALALAASDDNPTTRTLALEALTKVARIGTHLFHFVSFLKEMRGFGSAVRKSFNNWYLNRDADSLAYQVVKYQNRDGWSHRDILRLSHPVSSDEEVDAVFRWITGGMDAVRGSDRVVGKTTKNVSKRDNVEAKLPKIIKAFEEAKTSSVPDIVNLIKSVNLPREAIPTQHLKDVAIWEALLDKMPLEATIRNLGVMSSIGLLAPGSNAEQVVYDRITNQALLHKSRLHPIRILSAKMTYDMGRGLKGSNTWTVNKKISNALNDAFYASFTNVTPTNKKTLLALDVSGSMEMGFVNGVTGLTPRMASAALALVTARVEPDYEIIGFSPGINSKTAWTYNKGTTSPYYNRGSITKINITPSMDLNQVFSTIGGLPFSGTDCALPMLWAMDVGFAAENIAIYTDNETYETSMKAHQALKMMRKQLNVNAKLAVVGMTSDRFSIADPSDAGMMDFCGFSTDAPAMMSKFFG